ncbi:MAG TPA: hypothetical protein VKB24_06635 [Candidatus Acidoferrum sp.]|nr:hypothetical protein [Candidatus Acidoferrum sp.]
MVTQDPRKADPTDSTRTNIYFEPEAFGTGPIGQFGNANRQFFHGPGINNTDFGLSKRTLIRESMAFEFRVEFFNIFNHAQFNNPDGSFICSREENPGCDPGTFGQVTGTRFNGREGQISAKFYW